MKKKVILVSVIICFVSIINGWAQKEYPPNIECSKIANYKTVDNTNLKLWIFNPPKHKISDATPAIVFFFGGGWNAGSPTQFVPHCEYLAARGMVAIVADYRVKSRNNVLVKACVADAKSAIRWIRMNAGELGIDPNRIAAGGGSAGGHLAAATGTLSGFEEPGENVEISSRPNALVLFNPAVIVAPVDNMDSSSKKKMEGMEKRMGAKPEKMSPFHNVKSGVPPTIIFHGTGDTTVPLKTVELFQKKMKEYGNSCILVAYKNETHGFFNYGRKLNGAFVDSVNKMDNFLVSLGYIAASPTTEIIK